MLRQGQRIGQGQCRRMQFRQRRRKLMLGLGHVRHGAKRRRHWHLSLASLDQWLHEEMLPKPYQARRVARAICINMLEHPDSEHFAQMLVRCMEAYLEAHGT